MKEVILLFVWILVSCTLWLFAVALKADSKSIEFKARTIFYFISVVASFLIGTLL